MDETLSLPQWVVLLIGRKDLELEAARLRIAELEQAAKNLNAVLAQQSEPEADG